MTDHRMDDDYLEKNIEDNFYDGTLMPETEVQFYRRKAVGHLNSAYYNIGLLLDSKNLTRDEHAIAISCQAFIKKTVTYFKLKDMLDRRENKR